MRLSNAERACSDREGVMLSAVVIVVWKQGRYVVLQERLNLSEANVLSAPSDITKRFPNPKAIHVIPYIVSQPGGELAMALCQTQNVNLRPFFVPSFATLFG
jgi:hypothetical protein